MAITVHDICFTYSELEVYGLDVPPSVYVKLDMLEQAKLTKAIGVRVSVQILELIKQINVAPQNVPNGVLLTALDTDTGELATYHDPLVLPIAVGTEHTQTYDLEVLFKERFDVL